MISLVRTARPCDRLGAVRACAAFHAASGIPLPFCPDHVASIIAQYISDPSRLAVVVLNENSVVGVLLAHTCLSAMAPILISQEMVWWVNPTFRGRAPLKMLNIYEDWATQKGCKVIGMVGLNDPQIHRLYERRGFVLTENHYMKVVL